MRILIFFAISQESRGAKRFLRPGIELAHTGLGAPYPDALLTTVRSFAPDLIISTGFAGALADDLRPGDLIVDSRSDPNRSAALFDKSKNAPKRVVSGRIESVAMPLCSATAKRTLGISKRGLAVDMETENIFALASAAGTPVVAVRAILDEVTLSIPPRFTSLIAFGQTRARWDRLGIACLRHPIATAHLAKRAQTAKTSMHWALATLLPH